MYKVRFEFSKTGRARYLSHLDTMRVFQRALTRAAFPSSYSQGFNPHMRISIAFPLPLGVESVCEIIDLQLEHPVSGAIEKLNAVLPDGFAVTQTLPLFDVSKVTHIKYGLTFSRAFDNIFDGRPLVVQKKTKSGFIDLDVAQHITSIELNSPCLTVDLSAQNPTVTPAHIQAALRLFYPDLELTGAERLKLVLAEL